MRLQYSPFEQSCAQLYVDGTDMLEPRAMDLYSTCKLYSSQLHKYMVPHIEAASGVPEAAFCCAGLRLLRQKLLLFYGTNELLAALAHLHS